MKKSPRFLNLVLVFVILFSALGLMPKTIVRAQLTVLINEVDADTPGTDIAEFVELYDGGVGSTSLTGLALVFFNGSDDQSYEAFDLDGYTTNADGYFVLCNDAANVVNCDYDAGVTDNLIQNGADAVALYNDDAANFPNDTPVTTSNLIDAIVYDTNDGDDAALLVLLNEGQPQVNEDGGVDKDFESNQRCPNGDGGLRNTETYTQFVPTPGTENCVAVEVIEPKINEFSASTTGTDVEFIEVIGEPNTDYSAYTLLEIEGDSGTTTGHIDGIFPVGMTDTNGFYLADLEANDLENGTISLLLVKDFDGAYGDDIDVNNYGYIDYDGWSKLVDSIAVNDGGSGDITYGITVLFAYYDGLNYTPGGASRIPDGIDTESQSDWMRNEFDLNDSPAVGEAYNTPGASNAANGVAPEMPPVVTKTFPLNNAFNVAYDSNIEITFSELVTVTDPWFDITCSISGIHSATVTDSDPVFTLDPTTDFVPDEICTVNILPTGVNDDDVEDPPDLMDTIFTFSFTTIGDCDSSYTPIYEIQGDDFSTPLEGINLATEGVVVGDFQEGGKDGFYIQDPVGDSDPDTSDGIFVYAPSAVDVNVGDNVRVFGQASEYFGLTQIGSVSEMWVCEPEASLPAPTTLVLPVGSSYDFERHEGMYVTMPQDLVISEYFNFDRYGEIVLTSERFMQYTAVNDPDVDGYDAYDYDYFLSSITLDDGRTYQNPDPARHPNGAEFTLDNRFRGGDLVTNVTGVIDYSFSLYRVQPTEGADYTPVNLRTNAPDVIEGDLKVASFNVLNYFVTLDDGTNDICGPSANMECRGADNAEELTRQRDKILSAMTVIDADVFGLMEIENDSPLGAGDAVADLVSGLNAIVGAGTYDYINTGAIGTDAIKVALLYKPGSVTPVGDYQVLDSTVDARFIDDKNRPTLAQDFMEPLTGEIFTVAVNHLKSKGSDCDALGDPDLDDGAGNCNLTRLAAAEAMVDWLADETYFPESDKHLIIGDLNAYDKEDPIDAIKAGPDDYLGSDDDYVDMIYHLLGEDAYGYVFDGQIGYLDYALPNKALEPYVRDVAIWHINADEPDLIDYDTSFKQDAQDDIYAPDPYRSSDHDPVIVTLTFSNNPPVAVDDAYETAQDTMLIVAAPGVLANDVDLDEIDQMQADLETPPIHGELTLNLDGSFTYVPDPGFYGVDTFTYYLFSLPPSMTRGEYIDTATVTITVTPKYQLYLPITFGD